MIETANQSFLSHTTRLPRDGDIDGSDYYFVSNERFVELFEAGNFIETRGS